MNADAGDAQYQADSTVDTAAAPDAGPSRDHSMGLDDLPSNRGRWGTDDELGTLNLITDRVRARAAAEVRTGR